MHKNRVECCGLPNVRYAPDSDQIPRRSEMTLCANFGSREPYSIASSAKLTVTEEW